MKKQTLSSRTKAPELRHDLVQRPVLLNKLSMITAKKLLVVEAGAGRGKTTAINSLLSDYPAETVKWIRLAQDCNHLFVFWGYLVEALESQLGKFKNDFLAFFQAGAINQSIEEIVTFLCNCLFESEDIFIILDDFHLLTNPEVLKSFELFLAESPNAIHMVLLTRYEPNIYLGMLEMNNQLQYINQTDFLLTDVEALQFIKNTTGANLSDTEKQELLSFANGWIGGLQLLVAANLRTGLTELEDLKKNDRIFSDYLSKEIFQQLSETEQEFLIKTAYFNNVNKALCEELFPAVVFPKMMQTLLNKNLLIDCIDTTQQVYQYHPIFKEFLFKKFQLLSPKERNKLCLLGINSFIQQGDTEEALRLLLELKEYEQLMQLIVSEPHSVRFLYYLGEVPVVIASKNIDFAYQKIFYH